MHSQKLSIMWNYSTSQQSNTANKKHLPANQLNLRALRNVNSKEQPVRESALIICCPPSPSSSTGHLNHQVKLQFFPVIGCWCYRMIEWLRSIGSEAGSPINININQYNIYINIKLIWQVNVKVFNLLVVSFVPTSSSTLPRYHSLLYLVYCGPHSWIVYRCVHCFIHCCFYSFFCMLSSY